MILVRIVYIARYTRSYERGVICEFIFSVEDIQKYSCKDVRMKGKCVCNR